MEPAPEHRMESVPGQRNILGLQLPTDPRWVDLAAISLEDILTDHAWCEQKAATSCISLISRYPSRERLVEELSPIVTEEWGHFRLVLAELQKQAPPARTPNRKDLYVNKLREFVHKGGGEAQRFLDQLLSFALIEARSCERFKNDSVKAWMTPTSRQFYRRFMESEAGHYHLFIELAEAYLDKNTVRTRWKEWLNYEAGIMETAELRGNRIH